MVRRTAALVTAALTLTAPGYAAWSSDANGSAAAAAKTLPAGNVPNQPTASGSNVTVSWSASTFAGGGNVPAYVVRRYDTLGVEATVLAACSGLVTATTCTENGVPSGAWKYTVSPAAGSWRGIESGQSAPVVVV